MSYNNDGLVEMWRVLGYKIHDVPLEKNATCEKHGNYISYCYHDDKYEGCNVCKNERIEASRMREIEREKEQKRQALLNKILESGIPERFKTKTFDCYKTDCENQKQQKIFNFCMDYAENFSEIKETGRSFLMLGSVGVGKTHLSIAIALEIMSKGYNAKFTSVSKMLREIKETYRRGSEKTEKEVMREYTDCHLLIIDEVGVQRGNDYEANMMFDVINERYENLRPTIILSNLTIDEIKQFLGERVFDRLRENGGKAFLLDWTSHRGLKNE